MKYSCFKIFLFYP